MTARGVEGVAQDVFVRAYRALQSYSFERRTALRLRPWLYAIAHNLTRNAVRDAPPPSDPLDREDGAPRAALVDEGPGPEHTVLRYRGLLAVRAYLEEHDA